MELKLAWLYPDLLELYGDSGNITILKFRCEEIGINLIIDKFTVGDEFKTQDYDMVFLGGGSDREQSIFYDDLISRREDIIRAVEADVVFLIICGGYQLFGQYYKDSEERYLEGLGVFNYYTETAEERATGYIAIESELEGQNIKIVGFENHSGRTFNILNPLGKVINGIGNNESESSDGIQYRNVIGTYIHGPLLARNPELTDIIIKKMCDRKGYEVKFPSSINRFEEKAKNQVLSEFKK